MKHLSPRKSIALGLGVIAALTLTGCSTPDTPAPSSKPSVSQTHESVDYGTCVDGQVTILASQAKADEAVEVAECPSVAIVGTAEQGAQFSVGAVEKLVVEGSGITVHAESAGSIVVPGSGNTVTHGGESQVEDLGSDNTVTAG
ncbi:DUF3060 domain-containing protein [Curtobacterium sp. MCLR17_007]|uniref:DUF3060 domain-containing protein n=1 Tax=Curtobacterium sp. MCLR17_007 TaxID=2175648 RepID=UPI000DA7D992|nr:DUF3060 domain-containing protein [Curtobacterium sp. MCLR17_007]WIB60689.1 DUF3060 domain-containing protein [Curtobacterium sp. MCLR17_007]